MSKIQYKASGDETRVELNKKPGIWFCCHPADFQKYFESISEDILRFHNCVICYDVEPEADYEEKVLLNCLNDMRMFVVPVTATLLTEKSRARDFELRYAIDNKIHVLPLAVEPIHDEEYEQVFGKINYMRCYEMDALSYEERLNGDLDRILLAEDLVEKILQEFKAQLFLSYRHDDAAEAKKLMRRIHEEDFCRDIAIWYDKYLFLGENFEKDIERALQESNLFALAVTPNLLDIPNYISETEYPTANKAEKQILPVQIVPLTTEQIKQLGEDYDKIPPCVDEENGEDLSRKLREYLGAYILAGGEDEDFRHLYHIGMAYLNGVRVEADPVRAIELITRAAKAELPEAMRQLARIYEAGDGVAIDPESWLYWELSLTDYYREKTELDSSYRADLCQQLIGLATCQLRLRGLEASMETSKEAKLQLERLRAENPGADVEEMDLLLGIINMNMGRTLLSVAQFDNVEHVMNEAAEIFHRLEEKEPEKYGVFLVSFQNSQIDYFLQQILFALRIEDTDEMPDFAALEERFDMAEDLGRETLRGARNLPGSAAKEDLIAASCRGMASVLTVRQEASLAYSSLSGSPTVENEYSREVEDLYEEELEIYERLAEAHPNRYKWKVAQTKRVLNRHYLKLGQVDKIQEVYENRAGAKDPYQTFCAMRLPDLLQFHSINLDEGKLYVDAVVEYIEMISDLQSCLDVLDNFQGGEVQREKLFGLALQYWSEFAELSKQMDMGCETERMSLMHRLADHLWKRERYLESVNLDCEMLQVYPVCNPENKSPFFDILPAVVEAVQRICAFDRMEYLPGVAEDILRVADQASNIRAFSEAEEIYRELIAAEADGDERTSFWALLANYRLAIQKKKEEEFEQAISLLQNAVKMCLKDYESNRANNNNLFNLYMEMGKLQLGLQRPEEAERAYREALSYFEKEITKGERSFFDDGEQDFFYSSLLGDVVERSASFRMKLIAGEPVKDAKLVCSAYRSFEKILKEAYRNEEAVDMLLHAGNLIQEEFSGSPSAVSDPRAALVPILYTDVAEILSTMDRVDEAEKLLRELLDYWHSLSEYNRQMNTDELERCRRNLSGLLLAEGKESEAQEVNEKANRPRNTEESVKADIDLLRTCMAYDEKASDLTRKGKYKRALPFRQRAVNLYLKFYKNGSTGNNILFRMYSELALLQETLQHSDDAEEAYREAFSYFVKEERRKKNNRTGPSLLVAQSESAKYRAKRFREEWLQQKPKKEPIEETINDEEAVGRVCRGRAKLLREANREEEAVDTILCEVHFIREETNNPPKYGSLLLNLYADAAEILSDIERKKEVETLFREALDFWLSLPSSRQQEALDAFRRNLWGLDDLLHKEGRKSEMENIADMLLQEVHFIEGEIVDSQVYNAMAATIFTDVAEILSDTEQKEEAETLFRESLDYWLSPSSGAPLKDSEEMQRCYRGLVELFRASGRENEIEEVKEKVKLWMAQ